MLDNASAHVAGAIKGRRRQLAKIGVDLFYLPPYSPELNDIELVWRQAKYQDYPQRAQTSIDAISEAVDRAMTRPPGTGSSPVVVQSLRRVNGVQTIELKQFTDDILIGRTELEPLHDRWIDVDFQIKVGNGSAGSLRWILKNGSTMVIDKSRTGIDTFLADRVRPKWGIYRSLGDTSGSVQNCYLLLSNMRGYQLV